MRSLFPILVLVAATGVVATGTGTSSAATVPPSVRFTMIQYDSPGRDNRSAASLNAEWVRIANTTSAAVQRQGWTIRDRADHVYTFGSYRLGSGRQVLVHTGKGTNSRPDPQHRYWQSGNYIWNNDTDAATLRDNTGRTLQSLLVGQSRPGQLRKGAHPSQTDHRARAHPAGRRDALPNAFPVVGADAHRNDGDHADSSSGTTVVRRGRLSAAP